MRIYSCILAVCAVLATASAPLQVASAGNGGKNATQTIRSQASYSSDSVEAAQIQAWLESHATFHPTGEQVGDPSRITSGMRGTIVVEQVRSITGASGAYTVMEQEPPVPLPGSGNPGDTISITYTNGPYTYSWTYQWVSSEDGLGGQWVLIDYEMHYNPDWQKPR